MKMKKIGLHRHPLLGLGLVMAILAGCAGSPSAKFYQLTPLQSGTSVTDDISQEQRPTIAIAVHIPDYLDRPQIVTRAGENELKLSEFNRWAGSLESDVARVLRDDIFSLLPPDRFSVVVWTPYMESRLPASCKVDVHVERFEGTLGHSLLLKTQWEVFANDRRSLLIRESLVREQINGDSYDALVAAMSGALGRLSRQIAGGIGFVCK